MLTEERDFSEVGSSDEYWAKGEGQKTIRHLARKRREYYEVLIETGIQKLVRRSFDYYHGNWNSLPNAPGDMSIKHNPDTGNVHLGINEFRSLVQHLAILTTENPPAWDTLARNSSHKGIQQTILGNDILDYEMDGPHNVEERHRDAVEDSLIFTAGYVWTRWDKTKGKVVGPAQLGGSALEYEGDITHTNPNFYQVVYPWEMPWREKTWILVFQDENIWDLIALHPEKKEQILQARTKKSDLGPLDKLGLSPRGSDQVEVGYFYHLQTPAMPYGRMLKFTADVVLEDTYQTTGPVWDGGDLPEGDEPAGEDDTTALMWSDLGAQPEPEGWDLQLPVHRVIPSRYLLSSLGYSVAFDLQGFNEALNGELSTILNNHKNFAQVRVWAHINDQVNAEPLDAGSTLVRSAQQPVGLDLCRPIPEAFNMIELLRAMGEAISGVNSVSRGVPNENAKSGVALALIDQKAQQAASHLIAGSNQLLCDIGTSTLQIYQKHANSPRTIAAMSGNTRTAIKEFTSGDLDLIERVSVKTGNPLSRTISGRFEIANFLATNGIVTNKEEILTVLNTGQYKPLMRAELSELAIIGDENDRLSRGEPVRVSPLDNHSLHIREHHAYLDSTELRQDETIGGGIEAHLEQHLAMLRVPKIAEMQLVLGYQVPQFLLPPPAPPGGAVPPPGGQLLLPPPPGAAPPPHAGPVPPGHGAPPAPLPPGLSGALEPSGNPPAGAPHLPPVPPQVVSSLKDAGLKGKVIR